MKILSVFEKFKEILWFFENCIGIFAETLGEI